MTDVALINDLKVYFLTKAGNNAIGGNILPSATDTYSLGSAERRFDTLYVRNLVADTVTSSGGGGSVNADTVDGFHASLSPMENMLLPLNELAVFPEDVYPRALLLDGRRALEGNLAVSPDITIDGVDISFFKALYDEHDSQTAIEAHVSLGTFVRAGAGLENDLDTGELDPQGGLQNRQEIFLALQTPGTLSISSTNNRSGSHTHAITASSNPGASSQILKTADDGGLTLGVNLLQVQPSSGNIGIGTLSPTRKLHVEGNAYISDDLKVWGDFIEAPLAEAWFNHLTINSTLLTTNLNADYLDGRHGWQYRQSDSYLAGVRGWKLFDSGDAEFNNILARGRLDAVVYTEKQVSAVSGQMLMSIGAKVSVEMLNTASAIIVDAPVFSTDDIIQVNEKTNHEWMRVAGTFTIVDGGYQYPVARNINEDLAGPFTFTPGTVCIRRGSSSYYREVRPLAAGVEEGAFGQYQPGGSGSTTGGGWLILDGAHPFFAVEARKGPVWDQYDRVVHIGNLQGSQLEGKYPDEVYGVVFGDANDYFSYDQVNGLQIHTLGETTAETRIDHEGVLSQGLGALTVAAVPEYTEGSAKVYFKDGALRLHQQFQYTQKDVPVGDMLASVYDTDGDGIVEKADDADTVDGIQAARIVSGDDARRTTYAADPNADLPSGFYSVGVSANMPTTDWYEMLHARLPNTNNYALQIAQHVGNSTGTYLRNISNGSIGAWNKLWHAGNDGSGSGLDADLFDGMDSNRFVSGSNETKTTEITDPDAFLPSGFYQITGSAKMPNTNWWHLIHSRHTNLNNNYAFQVAQSFFDPSLTYTRYVNNGVAGAWNKVYHGGNALALQHCVVYSLTNQYGRNMYLPYDLESSDPNGWHSGTTNPSRIAIPTTGVYMFGANVMISGASAGSGGNLFIVKNRAEAVAGTQIQAGTEWQVTVSGAQKLYAGDYLEVFFEYWTNCTIYMTTIVGDEYDAALSLNYYPSFWVAKIL